MKIPNKDKALALFRKNACCLNKNFDDLEYLLSCTNKDFDVIAITKTSIANNVSLTNIVTMNNFSLKSPLLNPQQMVPFFILLSTYHINLAWA